jgi:peptide/nickel transport system permease protein
VHQYYNFIHHIFIEHDLGDSSRAREPVSDVLKRTMPVTGSLVIGGMVMWLLIAFPIGILSALYPRSLIDKGLMFFVIVGVSAHPVWLGLIFSWIFGLQLHWFPIGGYCDWTYAESSTNLCGGPTYWAYHMFLPWMTFACVFAALYARMIRASLLENLEEDYVRTARAKGAGTVRVMRGHVMRNAMLPVITMIGMDLGVAFAGALFIETVYELPGIGRLMVRSLVNGDLNMLLAIVLVVSFAVTIANLLVDIVYSIVDPRIRLRGKGAEPTESPGLRRQLRAQPQITTESGA